MESYDDEKAPYKLPKGIFLCVLYSSKKFIGLLVITNTISANLGIYCFLIVTGGSML